MRSILSKTMVSPEYIMEAVAYWPWWVFTKREQQDNINYTEVFANCAFVSVTKFVKSQTRNFTKQQLDVTTNIVCVSQYVNLYIYMCKCRTLNTKLSKVGCHHNKPTNHDEYNKWCTRIQMCSATPSSRRKSFNSVNHCSSQLHNSSRYEMKSNMRTAYHYTHQADPLSTVNIKCFQRNNPVL